MSTPDSASWSPVQWDLLLRNGTESTPLPFPLSPSVFTAPATEDEYALLASDTRARLEPSQRQLAQQLASVMRGALHTLNVYGGATTSAGDPPDPRVVRIHLSITDDAAAVIAQEPGDTAETGGVVHVWYGRREQAAARLAQLLPAATAAPGPVLTASQDEIDGNTPNRSFLNPEPTDDDRIRALAHKPRASDITIQLDRFVQEDIHTTSHTSWFAVEDLGSYLLEQQQDQFTLTPADNTAVAAYALQAVPAPEVPLFSVDDDHYYSRS